MSTDVLLLDLSGVSDSKYYTALAGVQKLPPEAGGAFVLQYLQHLQENTSLAEYKKSQRLTAVLRSIAVDAEGWNRVIAGATSLAPGLRNTLAQHLPPRHKRALVGAPEEAVTSVAVGPLTQTRPERVKTAALDQECATVIILSRLQIQGPNRGLLEAAGFSVMVWDSVSKLTNDIQAGAGDVCAFMLDSTILADLTEVAQRALIHEVAAFSTFAWIRIDQRALLVPVAEVERTIEDARASYGRVSARSLSLQPTGNISGAELQYLERARDALRTYRVVSFIPGELGSEQARLLIAAAKEYAEEENLASDVRIETLETRFLQAGNSAASIALVRINRGGCPIVAKLASREMISEEIMRFREFIQPWDNQLRPRVYFHSTASLILFTLVRAAVHSIEPAPMLASCLRELWDSELFDAGADPGVGNRREIALRDSVQNAARLLQDLNSRTASAGRVPYGDPSIHEALFQRLEARGITWEFAEEHRLSRRKASARYSRLGRVAVTHGDLHLKNILIRGNDDVHLIDYAASGPGHPAVDLVRLELALMLGVARELMSEAVATDMQHALTIEFAGEDELHARFPSFVACRVNRVVLAGCVAARDCALEVLARHGGGRDDYLAAKCVLAWQSLVMHDRHTMLARSIIAAVQPILSRWAESA